VGSWHLDLKDSKSICAHIVNWNNKTTLLNHLWLLCEILAGLLTIPDFVNGQYLDLHLFLQDVDLDIIEQASIVLHQLTQH
jgi:hypothetical protein